MVHISHRGIVTKPMICQFAFFNGVGWRVGKHLGIWNGVTPRDAEATRRVATMERAVARFLVSPGWNRCPDAAQSIFASRWPLNDQTI